MVLGAPGKVLQVAREEGVEHIVMLSASPSASAGGLAALFNNELQPLKDPEREEKLKRCGVPYTIVRTTSIKDTPGGEAGIQFRQQAADQAGSSSSSSSDSVTREDLAAVLVAALRFPPPAGGLVFEVSNSGSASVASGAGSGTNWAALFSQLEPKGPAAAATTPQ